MDKCNVFYSWQSDIRESRNFIGDCLKQIPKRLKDLLVVEIDRDTEGVAGSPNIGDTIYQKIDCADIFVADVTIINKDYEGRKTPNPNVLIELGYAIKSLGWERIILLYNKDCGDVEQLPFDINHQRMTAYCLTEETKAEVRKRIINNCAATVEILKQQGRLHGGKPLLKTSRIKLAKTMLEAMKRVYSYYDDRYCKELEDWDTNFVIITEAQFQFLDIMREVLEDEQYYAISSLLQDLKMAGTGSDDAYGWEYANDVAKKYFDPVYIEYGKKMRELSFEQVLSETFIELYNAIAGEETFMYSYERRKDDELVFKNDGYMQEAYDANGKLLCNVRIVDGLFTGFKTTDKYVGEYVNSKYHGEGQELTNRFNCLLLKCGDVRRKGIWEENQFIDGTIYSVLMHKNEADEYEMVDGGEEDVVTADMDLCKYMMESGEWVEEYQDYYFADIYLKNGEYDIVEGTLKPAREVYKYPELLDM